MVLSEGSFGCENWVLETIRKRIFFYFIKENCPNGNPFIKEVSEDVGKGWMSKG